MTAVNRRIAFLALEAGAAAYLAPLWLRLAEEGSGVTVCLSTVALRRLERMAYQAHASVCLEEIRDGFTLHSILAGKPDIVVASATGAVIEADMIEQAQTAAIPTLQIIDTWNNYAGRFCPGRAWPDRIAVIDSFAADEAVAECLPADRIEAVGQPAWERAQLLPPAPFERVLFVGQPVRKVLGGRLGYDEQSAWELCRSVAGRRPELVRELLYLPHPDEAMENLENVPHNAVVPDATLALTTCGTVLGMFSSLMVDAFLGGRRVVAVQPALRGADPCSLHRHGYIRSACNASELEGILNSPGASNQERVRASLIGSLDRLHALVLALSQTRSGACRP